MGATGYAATASITTGRRSPLPASWRVLADGPRRNEGNPQGLPERPAAEPGPGRIELQLATAGYSTGSCAELTPGQARAVASALPGLAGSAVRAGRGGRMRYLPGVRAAVVRHLVSGK